MLRVAALAALFLSLLAAAPLAQAGEIVVLKNADASVATETAERERDLGFDADHRFKHAIEGFSADLTPEQVAELRADPEVAEVIPNRPVHAAGNVAAVDDATVPSGVRRVTGTPVGMVRERADGAVAVLDTGVDLDHPDLNVEAGKNCIDATPPDDVDGHGTQVAGTIGARNDASGVTGVAPGTKIVAVKVLDDLGRGSTATVLCGIDWVIANHAARGITVANLSLGGDGTRSSCAGTERGAYCELAAAGVVPVVAAGNDGEDFGGSDLYPTQVPAVYPEVLTVAATVDTDGAPGGHGPTCGERDDSAAAFSNYATQDRDEAHLIAAPGACILSAAPGGATAWMSGTSMATPHVAGLVALCKGEGGDAGPCDGLTTPQVIARMRVQTAWSSFTGIEGRRFGILAFLSESSVPTPPVPAAEEDVARADQTVEQSPAVQAPAPQPDPPVIAPAPPLPPAEAVVPPRVTRPGLSVRTPRLATLRRSGMSVRVSCARACSGTLRLRVTRATARRLGLRSTTLGTARVRRAGTVRVRLTGPARRALSRSRSLRVTVAASLRAGGRTVSAQRAVSVRR